jgi:serine/threonine protein kinase
MLCPKCLSENTNTSKFCNNCGLSFGAEDKPGFIATKTLETPIQAISKGTLIAGKYRIIEEIGRGGMGIVFKAEDTKLKRIVALEFLPHQWTSDAAARERFIHEAQAASALDHPNICTIYEIEETADGRMYVAMAFYEGESLREKIKREPLKAEESVDIVIQVGQGMAKAHQKGIVHRDIKPANILITKDGAAKIVDFGLAKLAGQVKLTREGTTIDQRIIFPGAGNNDSYYVIATNRDDLSAREIVLFHNQRGEVENSIKELKIGLGMERMTSGDFKANALWFAIGVLATNVAAAQKLLFLGPEWKTKTIASVRWQLIQLAGRLVRHGRRVILRLAIAAEKMALLLETRGRIAAFI